MIRTHLRFLATLSLIGLTSVLMQSQSLELRPGYIAGSVAVGTETISYLSVNASSGSQSSSFNQSNVSAYSLTVNVPAGTTPTYSVRPTVYMDGNIDYIQLPSQNLVVSEGQTSQLDFTLSPAYVRGTVTVLNGTLQDAYIYSDNYAPATGTTSSANSRTNLSRGSQFRFAVAPGNVRAWATIYFGNGTQATVPVQSLGTVTAGSEVAFDITVTAPATDGAIQGTLSMSGPRISNSRTVHASGPASKSASPGANGAYTLSQLPAGNYHAFADLYFDQNRTHYRTPYGHAATGNPQITINGNTVTRDFTVKQAFIQGTFALTGTRTLAHSNSAQIYVNGKGNETQWGSGRDEISRPSGDYELIVSPGEWLMNNYNYVFFYDPTPARYLQGYLYIYDYQNASTAILVGEGDVATRNLTYETGTVSVVLRSSGITFGSPRVSVSCSEIVNGQWRTQSFGSFYGNATNVNAAPVTFVGIRGSCTVDAYGRITGSSSDTYFGRIPVGVVPGSDLVVDVGGPTLKVTSPAANSAHTSGPITVTGTATDDQQVTSITVNGAAAAFTSTNNPADAQEVSFSVSVPLVSGANQIAVVATDNTGKSAADTRNVYLDSQNPAVTWSPADGTTYPTPQTITITGTATDNIGISSITVNGAVVYTNAGTPQTSVNFSRTQTFSGGTHQLTVVIKDLGNLTTTETRTITVNAPKSLTSVTTSPNPSVSGQSVTLTATVSPDGTSAGTPSGSVGFQVDGVSVGTGFLNGATASLTLSNMAVGTRAISATYNGSFIYLGSTGTASHTVDKIATATSLSSSLNPSTFGQNVTFTAQVAAVAPGTGTPPGSVQFRRNGLDEGAPVSLFSGSASRAFTGLAAGSATVEAVYLGSASFQTSTGSMTQTVNQAVPSLTWSTPAQITYGTPLGATQLNASATVAGTFSYDPAAGTVLNAGTHTLRVTFTPTSQNYESRTTTVLLSVARAKPVVSTTGGTFTYDGTPRASTGSASVPGTFSYAYTPGGANPPVNAAASPYQVVATFTPDDAVNYDQATATSSITITKASPTVTWADAADIVYGTTLGTAQLNATAPVPGSFVYTPAAGTVLNAGASQSLDVSFTPDDATNYNDAAASVRITVLKAPATLTLTGLSHTYDGNGKGAGATTDPAGLSGVSLTYDGSPTAPTAAGTYTVVASLTHANYQAADATGTLTIAKAPATVSLAGLSQVYDGTARVVAATTTPGGLSVDVTYDGAANPPANAGSYAVSAVVNDQNYAGSVTDTLVVMKAPATLTLTGLSHTYDGNGKGAGATTDPAGLSGVSLTYDGSPSEPVSAGSYAVRASLAHVNYEAAETTGTLTIAKATASLSLGALAQVYNGSPRVVTATTTPGGLSGVAVTYDGQSSAPVNAGSYAIGATLNDPNYDAPAVTGTLVVAKASAALTISSLSHTYDGAAKSAVVTTNPSGLGVVSVTYDGGSTPPAGAGSYAVAAVLDHANYAAPAASAVLAIAKGGQSITFDPLANRLFGDPAFTVSAVASSGLPVSFTASGGCSASGATITLTAAGACTVMAAQAGDANHLPAASVSRVFSVFHSWSHVRQPINVDGSSIFKLGSTVPVKFGLTGGSAGITDLVAKIFVAKVSAGVIGSEVEAVATNNADGGNTFRYDPSADQYIFNLGTKGLSQGTWQLRVDLGDGATYTVLLSLKK